MKRHLLLITLALLLAVSVNAQTIGVYWDEAGLQSEFPTGSGETFAPTFTGYVIIFAEDVVSGAAYGLNIAGSDIMFASATYPDGLQIGDPFLGGVEIGMTNVMYGFGATPVVVSTLLFVNMSGGAAHAAVSVVPHANYGDAIYADGGAAVQTLNVMAEAIANENMTFGGVKNLFR